MKKLLPERRREKPQIILTNLIDVILLLVFFFMITTSFAKGKNRIPIELPKASSAAAMDADVLTVQVDTGARIMVAGAPIAPADLTAKVTEYLAENRDRAILLEADVGLDYGRVVSVLDTIRTAGGVNIGLATRQNGAKH
ncbi:MAG: biopolymer transporter ExbD [Candidatus Riflebacteria bacterium]|nr:biopolymer transporter ExbD [Candidatus Riflebacteria bacterium]